MGEEDENFSSENIEDGRSCDSSEKSNSCSTARFDLSCESREEVRILPSPLQPVEVSPSPFSQSPSTIIQPLSPLLPSEIKLVSRESGPRQNIQDPCSCQRENLRAVFDKPSKPSTFSARKMEVCQNGRECHDVQECGDDFNEDLKNKCYKETCLTECLDGEFTTIIFRTHRRTSTINTIPLPSPLAFYH